MRPRPAGIRPPARQAVVMLIDPEGRRVASLPVGEPAWVAQAIRLDARKEDPDPVSADGEVEHTALAVRDLGFVEVSGVRDGVQVRLRPLLVSGPAATQVFFALADIRPPRVVLVRYDDERQQWRHEICGHWRNAVDRMNTLVFANERLPSYTATELDLAEIDGLRDDAPSALHQLWERDRCLPTHRPEDAFARLAAARHSLLVAQDAGDHTLRIRHLGGGLQFYGTEWAAAATGRDLADQPDALFAARVVANLRRSIALDRPLFHRVEAVVRRNARTAVQVSYRRLVLPWQLADGRRAASSTILLDQFIEITR